MTQIKAIIFDLDGTLYLGDNVIDGAVETIDKLHDMGIRTFYLTNNSSKTRSQIQAKLEKMGIRCDLNEVYTSAYVAAKCIQKLNLHDPYIFGTNGLKEEIAGQGISICEDEDQSNSLVIGFDTECTFEKMTRALRSALRAEKIIACNKERKYPGNDGKIMPGCGAMVASIEWCSNRKIDLVIGKPETTALDILCNENSLKSDEIIVVGDTYESDIAMAAKYHSKSVLIGHCDDPDQPQIESVSELIPKITDSNNSLV